MKKLSFHQIKNQDVQSVIKGYPRDAISKMLSLRQLVLEAATELNLAETLVETLKWGEPSYIAPQGSTLRIAWKKSIPDQIGIYFNCKTNLIETIKEIYPSQFNCQGKRAILINLDENLQTKQLKCCIGLALTYHLRKSKPLLGVVPE